VVRSEALVPYRTVRTVHDNTNPKGIFGQSRKSAPYPYMTVCMVNFLLKIPYYNVYTHGVYLQMYGSGQPYIKNMHDLVILSMHARRVITLYKLFGC
jgi:hypothetical protein